jgi:hypothetical protein
MEVRDGVGVPVGPTVPVTVAVDVGVVTALALAVATGVAVSVASPGTRVSDKKGEVAVIINQAVADPRWPLAVTAYWSSARLSGTLKWKLTVPPLLACSESSCEPLNCSCTVSLGAKFEAEAMTEIPGGPDWSERDRPGGSG